MGAESSEPILQLLPAFAGLEKAAIIRQGELELRWTDCYKPLPIAPGKDEQVTNAAGGINAAAGERPRGS